MRDTRLADELRRHDLAVVEVAGWQTRGSSTFHPGGSVNHHTAGSPRGNAPSLGVCIRGREGLPGPLCNVLLGRDGTCYVIAAGRANHAGRGGWAGLSGNASVWGLEVENVGTPAEPWTGAQVDRMARVHAAFAGLSGFCERSVCQHKEWAPARKVDAHSIDGDAFRSMVARHLRSPAPTPTTTTVTEDPMFLAIDKFGLFAVVDGVPIGLPTLAEFAKARAASDGVPMMWLPEDEGRQLFAWLLRRLDASVS